MEAQRKGVCGWTVWLTMEPTPASAMVQQQRMIVPWSVVFRVMLTGVRGRVLNLACFERKSMAGSVQGLGYAYGSSVKGGKGV